MNVVALHGLLNVNLVTERGGTQCSFHICQPSQLKEWNGMVQPCVSG